MKIIAIYRGPGSGIALLEILKTKDFLVFSKSEIQDIKTPEEILIENLKKQSDKFLKDIYSEEIPKIIFEEKKSQKILKKEIKQELFSKKNYFLFHRKIMKK